MLTGNISVSAVAEGESSSAKVDRVNIIFTFRVKIVSELPACRPAGINRALIKKRAGEGFEEGES